MILIKLRAISDSNAAIVQQRVIPPDYSRQIDKPRDNGLLSEEAIWFCHGRTDSALAEGEEY